MKTKLPAHRCGYPCSVSDTHSKTWEENRLAGKGRSLPGLDVERVRTFDAPEALGINFHEVRAKSALNKVPGSYLPFNWTVNAFRGCAHACPFALPARRIPIWT